ncbi:MAG TPA: hypothetical protein VFQ53_22080 [Kofleriaceae bacterium]|nr:hypothetical protein [Kofleriaceae bacterium]
MRVALLVVATLIAGCGRIGFDEQVAPSPDGRLIDHIDQLVAYANQTCVIVNDAALCWGANDAGQLGDESTVDRTVPTPVHLPAGIVTRISQGESHACAIVEGVLYCWGATFDVKPAAFPLANAIGPVAEVGCGRGLSCAIVDARAQCWGINSAGQLGDGTQTDRATPAPIADAIELATLSVGDDHACAQGPAIGPVCWGHNDDGALGFGAAVPDISSTPTFVVADVTAMPQIAGWHACGLATGNLLCWGRNTEGELGDGTLTSSALAVQVKGLANVEAFAVGGGPTDFDASCAIVGGLVSCWGAGTQGRLGNGDVQSSPVPVPVTGLPAAARAVAIGYDHACALLVTNEIYCWGAGTRGQLGDGKQQSSLTPVRVAL